jgi:hypothetical protein
MKYPSLLKEIADDDSKIGDDDIDIEDLLKVNQINGSRRWHVATFYQSESFKVGPSIIRSRQSSLVSKLSMMTLSSTTE